MTDNWPEVAIIILNWNHYEDTIECLKSLQQLIYSDYQIILVDNGSNDDSVSRIKEWASEHISRRAISVDFGKEEQVIQSLVIDRKAGEAQEDTELAFHSFPSSPNLISNRKLILIEARENLGFAAGCNVGIRLAISLNYKYVLLLNNDTVVNPDFLSVMVTHVQRYKDVGIVGPKVYYADGGKKIWYAGGKLSLFKPGGISFGQGKQDALHYNEIKGVTFVTGASMLINCEVFRTVGLLDERFFFGMEDYDLCRRALNKGYRLLYVPNAIVYHKVGGSRVHNLADVYQGYKTSIIYMKKRLPWWIFVFWFCLYATYVLIISPYKNRSELYRLPKSSYKMAVLLGLIKGLFNSRVRREDMEIVVNRGLFRRG